MATRSISVTFNEPGTSTVTFFDVFGQPSYVVTAGQPTVIITQVILSSTSSQAPPTPQAATSLQGASNTSSTITQVINSAAPESPTTTSVRTAGNTLVFNTTINATTTGPVGVLFTTVVNNGSLVRDVGLKPGPVAGVGIGLAVLGALIAIVAMLLLQKRRKKNHRSSRSSNYTSNNGGHAPAETLAIRAGEKSTVTTDVTDPDYLLPQPKDDQSMGAATNQLFVQIGNHVENFYHDDPVKDNMAARSEEEQLLVGRKTRFFALKRYICREMLAAMAWDCPPDHSLLPAAAVSTAQKMSRGTLDEKAYEVAWSRWRVSTSMLLRDEDQSHKVQAYEFWLDRLQTQLRPFQINDRDSSARANQDLHAICKIAEGLAKLLLSQGARWEFHWPRDDSRSQIVIFPEFIRKTDSKGRRLDHARRVLEAQKMQ